MRDSVAKLSRNKLRSYANISGAANITNHHVNISNGLSGLKYENIQHYYLIETIPASRLRCNLRDDKSVTRGTQPALRFLHLLQRFKILQTLLTCSAQHHQAKLRCRHCISQRIVAFIIVYGELREPVIQ